MKPKPLTVHKIGAIPHPVWALVVCAVFTAVGVAVLDDYGVSRDEFLQREIALETISYVLGQDDELMRNLLGRNHQKFWGLYTCLPTAIFSCGEGRNRHGINAIRAGGVGRPRIGGG